MRIARGHTVQVYRFTRDRYGDAETETLVGTIEQCHLDHGVTLHYRTTNGFQETSELSTVLFAPRDAAVKLEQRDRFVLDGDTYRVVSGRVWDENHPVTGRDYGMYAVQVESVL